MPIAPPPTPLQSKLYEALAAVIVTVICLIVLSPLVWLAVDIYRRIL